MKQDKFVQVSEFFKKNKLEKIKRRVDVSNSDNYILEANYKYSKFSARQLITQLQKFFNIHGSCVYINDDDKEIYIK